MSIGKLPANVQTFRNQSIIKGRTTLNKPCTYASQLRRVLWNPESNASQLRRIALVRRVEVLFYEASKNHVSEIGPWCYDKHETLRTSSTFCFCINILFIAGQVCLSNTLDITRNKLQVTWIPSEKPRLDFQVKTSGVVRLKIKGASNFPRVIAFVGVNETIKYKGVLLFLLLSVCLFFFFFFVFCLSFFI